MLLPNQNQEIAYDGEAAEQTIAADFQDPIVESTVGSAILEVVKRLRLGQKRLE